MRNNRLAASAVAFWLLAGPAGAADVTMQWDPNMEGDLAGYRLFWAQHSLLGTTPAQTGADASVNKLEIPNAAAVSTNVTGLTERTLYYFRLLAYDTSGNQSDFNVDAAGNPAEVIVFVSGSSEAKAPEKFLSPALNDGINDAAFFGALAEEITIMDINSRQVFHKTRSENNGNRLTWDGRDVSGRLVPSGIYIAKIKRSDGRTEYQNFSIVK